MEGSVLIKQERESEGEEVDVDDEAILDEENCLFCSTNCDFIDAAVSREKLKTLWTKYNSNKDKGMSDHLMSIFILKEVLNFPRKESTKLMWRMGGVNPGEWFRVCGECSKTVEKIFGAEQRIQLLERRILRWKKMATDKLKMSLALEKREESKRVGHMNIVTGRSIIRGYFYDKKETGVQQQGTFCSNKIEEGSIFSCKECNTIFMNQFSLDFHRASNHSLERCDICGTSERDKIALQRHQRRCHEICSNQQVETKRICRQFSKKLLTKSHNQLIGLRNAIEELQEKRNLKQRTGRKCQRYKCQSCSASFSKYTYLKAHFTVAHLISKIETEGERQPAALPLSSPSPQANLSNLADSTEPLSSPETKIKKPEQLIMPQKTSQSGSVTSSNIFKASTLSVIPKPSQTSISPVNPEPVQISAPPICLQIAQTDAPPVDPESAQMSATDVDPETTQISAPSVRPKRSRAKAIPEPPTSDLLPPKKRRISKSVLKSDTVPGPTGKFQCRICHTSYNKAYSLKAHMDTHKLSKSFCYICQFPVQSDNGLQRHMSVSHPDHKDTNGYFRCPKCDFVCGNKYKKFIHNGEHKILDCFITQKTKGTLTCSLCPVIFTTFKDAFSHLKETHKEMVQSLLKRFKCQICKLSFHLEPNLKKHLAEAHKQGTYVEQVSLQRYQCTQCDHSFKTSSSLKAHMERHDGVRALFCVECGAGFYRSTELARHSNVFHSQKQNDRMVCTLCGKISANQRALQNHQRRQHGPNSEALKEKRKQTQGACVHCGLKLKHKTDLQRHWEKDHPELFIHHCSFCSQKYTTLTGLLSHGKLKHPKESVQHSN